MPTASSTPVNAENGALVRRQGAPEALHMTTIADVQCNRDFYPTAAGPLPGSDQLTLKLNSSRSVTSAPGWRCGSSVSTWRR